MMKAVNMKGIKFGKLANIEYIGFGIFDQETKSFLADDHGHVITYRRKRDAEFAYLAGIELAFPNRKAATC